MSEQSWPYAGDAVTEAEWSAMSRLWRQSGVVDGAGNELAVTAVTGELQVQVASGQAWLDGFYYQSTSAVTLTIGTADLGAGRIDLVGVRSDRGEGEARLAVKTGTPAGTPSAPTVEQDHDGSGIFEIALAEVTVAAAAGNVDGQVVDVRTFSLVPQAMVNPSSLGQEGATSGDVLAWDGSQWGASGAYATQADVGQAVDNATDELVQRVGGDLRGYREPGATPGDSGTVTLDLSEHNVFEVDPSGQIDFEFSGLPPAGEHASFTLIVHNDTHALTWPVGTEHPGGDPPELDGKTYLSGVVEADGTVVVGSAFAGVA